MSCTVRNLRDLRLTNLWLKDTPVPEIAEHLGVSEQQVYQCASRLRAKGVQLPHRSPAGARALRPVRGTPYEQMLAGTWERAA